MKTSTRERGFALLLVFVLAASIAIFLYMQLPRVAFEAQRDKEQTLIDRGEQYKRAIGLFVKKNGGKYPAKIEDLENYNNVRFLRHRYKDPMTGEDEWRLIHVGPGGVLLDSVTSKNKAQGKEGEDKSTSNQFISEMPGLGQEPAAGGTNAVATRRRASDMPGAPGQVPEPSAGGTAVTVDPNNPMASNGPMPPPGMNMAQTYPNQPGAEVNGAYPQNPYVTGRAAQGNATGSYPTGYGPGAPTTPSNQGLQAYGQGYSGAVGYPSAVGQPNPSGQSMNQPGNMPYGIPGVPQGSNSQGTNAALQQIRNMLSNPRPIGATGYPAQSTTSTAQPGGFGSSGNSTGFGQSSFGSNSTGSFGTPMSQSGSGSSSFGGGQIMGSQIAGVASKAKGDAIKTYNDRTKYDEWEFIYDPAKDKSRGLAQSINGGGMPNSGSNSNSPFGGSSSFGSNSSNNSFGSSNSNNSVGGSGSSGSFGGNSNTPSPSFGQMGPR